MMLLPLAGLLFFVQVVHGHGFVYKVTLENTTYTGNIPGTDQPSSSVIRQITTQDPVMDASNPDLNCGPGVQFAQDVAPANPGDQITFDWREADLEAWPHNTGPMMTYMTSCGSTPCTNYNSSTSKWFKIQQVGWKPDGSEWAQADLMQGAVAVVNLPSNLAPGNYLIRHEIIALHQANVIDGAQFYPSCTQLRVGGNQTGVPAADDLVELPGAYNNDDPGLYDPNNNFYDSTAPYQFPGPPVASFVQETNTTATTMPGTSTSPTTSPPSPASPPASSSASTQGVCQLKTHQATNISSVVDSVLNWRRDLRLAFGALSM